MIYVIPQRVSGSFPSAGPTCLRVQKLFPEANESQLLDSKSQIARQLNLEPGMDPKLKSLAWEFFL